MGQRNGFSKGDVAKLNAMYSCDKSNIGGGVASSPGRPTLKPIAIVTNALKPAAASTTTSSRPLLNFLGNLLKPRKDEDSEDSADEWLDAIEEDSSNTID